MARAKPVPGKVKRVRSEQIAQAAKLFEDFTGHKGEVTEYAQMPRIGSAVACIGEVEIIAYVATRDGKRERYAHKFRKSSRPLLCVTHDGKTLLMLGGAYKFTDRGIEDR